MSNILEFDQIIEIEKDFVARAEENGYEDYYKFMHKIFIQFAKDKSVLDTFMKSRTECRNVFQLYVLLAFAGMVVTFFQSPVFRPKNTNDSQNAAMEEYIKEHYKLMRFNDMLDSSKQPVLLEYLNSIIRETDRLEMGMFTGGEELGDRAKRYEIVSDISFLINFLNTFYFE
ncbi:MAG: hypothetical protein FWG29_02600 [Treponema sp.]|nr:hypothetical protein [Treponema sp.]